MKRERYMRGIQGEQYGIWNTVRKCWQFDICEDTPMLAEARLVQKIGDDARKWRFEARVLPKEMRRFQPKTSLRHGKWEKATCNTILDKAVISNALKCSECGKWKFKNTLITQEFYYCPNCGAKMDGGQ